MAVLMRKVSAVTNKGQTTVPKSVRQALGVDFGGRIAYYVDDTSRVTLERDDAENDDPVIERFLDFIEEDMIHNPHKSIMSIPPSLRDRIALLTKGMDVDLEAPIDGEVSL